MDELTYSACRNAVPFKRFEQDGFYSLRRLVRCGEGFTERESTGSVVEDNQVSERTPYIHPYAVMPGGLFHHWVSSLGNRLKGKISTCGERCCASRPPSTT